MIRNVLTWLEQSAVKRPHDPAFEDFQGRITFDELWRKAREIGSFLAQRVVAQSPVILLLDKAPITIAAMMGVVYAGCFYSPVDASMPESRLQLIAAQLNATHILCNRKYQEQAQHLQGQVCVLEDIPGYVDEALLAQRQRNHIDNDLLYVLFTSGSTGVPKGVAITHRSVIDFIEWACDALAIETGSRLGNQAPLYFDNSVLDLYCSIRTQSCVFFLPQMDFAFPGRLLSDLDRCTIDTIFWVPSALTAVASSGLLKEHSLQLKRVFFCGEIMPCKTLNSWRKALPNARFINMYGPTEITDVCTWYEVNRDFKDDESLPIGFPCANTRILLIENEICVAGTCLAAGYYNAPDKTAEAFVRNPLRPQVNELIYRTGDLGAYNDRGELMFLGRYDSQIKRNGYRIELGEIECALCSLDGVSSGCCIYDATSEKIVCVYSGSLTDKQVRSELKTRIPKYMLPDRYLQMDKLPVTGSGKIDRMSVRQVIIHEHSLP